MKTLICLVRHGQTDWNKAHLIQGRINIPLNDVGKFQLTETGTKIQKLNINWDIYLSSPLQRAYTSCEIIRSILCDQNKTIEIRPNLIEREFGQADGTTINQSVYDKILIDEINGMEKSYEIQKRAVDEIKSIAKKYRGKNIIIVTHSHFIKAIFTVLDNSLTFQSYLKNGGLNFIEFEDDKIVSFKFNQ